MHNIRIIWNNITATNVIYYILTNNIIRFIWKLCKYLSHSPQVIIRGAVTASARQVAREMRKIRYKLTVFKFFSMRMRKKWSSLMRPLRPRLGAVVFQAQKWQFAETTCISSSPELNFNYMCNRFENTIQSFSYRDITVDHLNGWFLHVLVCQ